MDDYYDYLLGDVEQDQFRDPSSDNPFSYSVPSGRFDYNDGEYNDEVDELLNEIGEYMRDGAIL